MISPLSPNVQNPLLQGLGSLSRRSALVLAAKACCVPALVSPLAPSAHAQAGASPVVEPGDASSALAETWRAASRFGYGLNATLAERLPSQGGKNWAMAQLVAAQQASVQPVNVVGQNFIMPLPDLFDLARQARESERAVKPGAMPTSGVDAVPEPQRRLRALVQSVKAWRLSACTSPNLEPPLLARLTEFWFNHLNVHIDKGAVRPFVGDYLVRVIRTHCLGTFENLLLASARHPAMLLYLDQAQSVAPGLNARGERKGLNENYAREVMELHTLGVNGGYTQSDVRELARVLTGWTVHRNLPSGFAFRPVAHDTGTKVVLGQAFWNQGEQEGERALRLLARHPSTAQRIGLRLAQFFVSDQPPAALVDRLRQRFLATQGDLMAVMQTLITSPETWDANQRLFKTPYDYACSVLTAMGGANDRASQQRSLAFLNDAGQPLLAWATPDGYSFDQARWLVPEALTRRADFALGLGRNGPSLDFLFPYLSPNTQRVVAAEAGNNRNGLMLAGPDFMWK